MRRALHRVWGLAPSRARRRGPQARRKAFSLIEVMVALAILALTLTALFGAEVGAFKAGYTAHRMTEATLLARCKMAEIEAEVAEHGFQLNEVTEAREPCCADEESDLFSCDWKIEPLEIADLEADEIGADSNPLGNLLGGAAGGPDPASVTGGRSMEDVLAGGGADGDMAAGLASEFVWPIVAPSFASQVRRVTVTIHWGVGKEKREGFDVVQYVVLEPGTGTLTDQAIPGLSPGDPAPSLPNLGSQGGT